MLYDHLKPVDEEDDWVPNCDGGHHEPEAREDDRLLTVLIEVNVIINTVNHN